MAKAKKLNITKTSRRAVFAAAARRLPIPAAPQSGTPQQLAAFKDLEGDVHDIHRMSQLMVRAIEDGMGDQARSTSKSEREMALFAVYKLQDMVAGFRKRFLACWSIGGARTRKAARP